MTCKIERDLAAGDFVVFRVSGRIDGGYVELLQELIENEKIEKGRLALDLTEVTVVSLEAVRALTIAGPAASNFETVRPTYANGFPE